MPRTAALCIVLSLISITWTGAAGRALHSPAPRLQIFDGAPARIELHPATGTPTLVHFPGAAPKRAGEVPERAARSYFERHAGLYGIASPADDLELVAERWDRFGRLHLGFAQRHRGLPVFGAVVRVHFTEDGALKTVNGVTVPAIDVDTEAKVSPEEAAEIGRAAAGKRHGIPAGRLSAAHSKLLVFRSGLVRGVSGRNHLAWRIEIGDGGTVREALFIDAIDGRVLDRISLLHEIDRAVHGRRYPNPVWTEGDTLPFSGFDDEGLDQEANQLIESSLETYGLFMNLSGGEFDSFDGRGATMHGVIDWDFDECPNAAWNGVATNYCSGLAVDDVIAHEWTHAYTDNTHDLIYQWQPGALNEAYSDIFGEVVDLLNGTGRDTPNRRRSDNGCSTFFGSTGATVEVLSPTSIAGFLEVREGTFSPAPPWSVTAPVELADDGTGATADACQPLLRFTSGNIAVIDRGECDFTDKAENAAAAGAAGIIIVNNQGDALINMGGAPSGGYETPAVFMGQSNGETIKAALAAGVEATMAHALPSDSSVRWLIGEDADGGALRDMWNPACLGDPAKVSDSRYWCFDPDNGGVHINNGVPNRAFALLVDGGRDVQPIGLTKAAHVYWHAMVIYQVPTTAFGEHADLLELSCEDLVGQQLTDLVTGEISNAVVDSFDCQQVANAMLAVEMRLDPSQCNFQPVLAAPAPAVALPYPAFSEDFETDPAGRWILSNDGVFEEYRPRDWQWTKIPPGDRTGGVLRAVNSSFIGNCTTDDQSGVLRAESPGITLPAWATTTMLVFDHYVALEEQWDGGNLKISVNGGDFQLVEPGSFVFNPYNGAVIDVTTIENEDGDEEEVANANPLAGEAAWTGADEGRVEGSWGQSQVDLSAYASGGDTIRLRFEMGQDGCTGIEGWFLDDVKVMTDGPGTLQVLRPSGRRMP